MSDVHPETQARMVDVSAKAVTGRRAVASCRVVMSQATRSLVVERALEKGDALEAARIAGIMAAKKTAELIPLCHPIGITAVDVELTPIESGIEIRTTVKTAERTGVEMEALTGAAVAALTIYDMVKGVERDVEITDVRLIEKTGGKSGDWRR